jgi:hypothetical protein
MFHSSFVDSYCKISSCYVQVSFYTMATKEKS